MDYKSKGRVAKQPAPRVGEESKKKAVPVEEPKEKVAPPSKYRTISDVMNALQENSHSDGVLRGIARHFGAEYSSDFNTLYGRVIGKANDHFNRS